MKEADLLAFPQPENYVGENAGGMTLRDWFAGQVLQAVFLQNADRATSAEIAFQAYAVADMMLKARQ